MRRPLLSYAAPALLVVVAAAQFAVAKTTSLTPWKLGGFGMFSTSNSSAYRVLRVTIETDDGQFVVPGPTGSAWARTWPRGPVLRRSAQEAACGRWRFLPLDSLGSAPAPGPAWDALYQEPGVRAQTALAGIAVPDTSGVAPGAGVRSARASVTWVRLDTEADRAVLRPVPVASEAVAPSEAGCPAP